MIFALFQKLTTVPTAKHFLFGISVFTLSVAFSCDAYPHFWQRLIWRRGVVIHKMVDLISDYHGIEIGTKQYHLGKSEQGLYEALQKIGNAQKGDSIEYIAETAAEDMAKGLGKKLLNCAMYEKSANAQDRKLIYTSGDCYRDLLKPDNFPVIRVQLINARESIVHIEQDLLALKQRVEPEIYAAVHDLWASYKVDVLSRKNQWVGKVAAQVSCYKITDFEMLIKLLGSKQRHSIVYAGTAHCDNLGEWLVGRLNFARTNEAGRNDLKEFMASLSTLHKHNAREEEVEIEIQKNWPPLPASTWDHLGALKGKD